ncbi:MAG: PDZ domain-containing protein [Gammaproteobacteria bacterium]|nr:MAG: PDZ domain-containing protein [Gammaproteobacteria bacterium]
MANPRLSQQMAYMIALESRIADMFTKRHENLKGNQMVSGLIEDIVRSAKEQKSALINRLGEVDSSASIPALSGKNSGELEGWVAASALQDAYTALNEAIIGYTTLSIIAKRSRDSAVIGDGNTTDIADQHMRNYIANVRSISDLLHDVVIGELNHDGHSCECTCACCGIGLCICSTYNKETLSNAWVEAIPFADEGDVLVLEPRAGSPAAEAGLKQGDFIVAADGTDMASYATLYEIADGHQSGDKMELTVRRASGDLTNVSVKIP